MLPWLRWPRYRPDQSPGSRRGLALLRARVKRAAKTVASVLQRREDDRMPVLPLGDQLCAESRIDARAVQLHDRAGIHGQATRRGVPARSPSPPASGMPSRGAHVEEHGVFRIDLRDAFEAARSRRPPDRCAATQTARPDRSSADSATARPPVATSDTATRRVASDAGPSLPAAIHEHDLVLVIMARRACRRGRPAASPD